VPPARPYQITIKVKQVSGGPDIFLPPMSEATPVGHVKTLLEGHVSAPRVAIRLVHKGKILKDEDSLAASNVKSNETIIVQVNKKALPASAGAAASPVAEAVSPVAAPVASPVAAAASPVASVAPPVATSAAALDDMYGDAAPAGPPEMLAAMDGLERGNDAGAARLGFETLVKIIDNVIKNPTEEKYRQIKKENAVFNRKVGGSSFRFMRFDDLTPWILTCSDRHLPLPRAGRRAPWRRRMRPGLRLRRKC